MKPYRYKLSPRPPKLPLNRLQDEDEQRPLTGYVRGQDASQWEEWASWWLDSKKYDYKFQVEYRPQTTIPGQDYIVDFVVENRYPIELDAEFTHKSAESKAHDALRDEVLNEMFRSMGMFPIHRILLAEGMDQNDLYYELEKIL